MVKRAGKGYAIGRRYKRRGGKLVIARPRFRIGSKETHNYKRYMRDVVLQNDFTSPNSDLNWEVDGASYGKTYENFTLTNLFADTNNTSMIGGCMGFNMNMLPALSDYTTLYDKYKLRAVRLTITPLANFASAANLGTLPVISYCYDQDDLTLPLGQDTIRQYGTCKIKRLDKPVHIYLKPKMLLSATSNGFGAAGDVVSAPKYLDMTNTGVTHFGIKFWLNNVLLGNTTNVNALFRFSAKYYFTCSATR